MAIVRSCTGSIGHELLFRADLCAVRRIASIEHRTDIAERKGAKVTGGCDGEVECAL